VSTLPVSPALVAALFVAYLIVGLIVHRVLWGGR
jgi:hypothetical protein